MRGLSLVVASGGHSSSRCVGLSLSWPLLLWSTGSRRAGSAVVAHGPSSSAACGIFPDQGSNPCPLHWQADSQPLRHQGSPGLFLRRTRERCAQECGDIGYGGGKGLGRWKRGTLTVGLPSAHFPHTTHHTPQAAAPGSGCGENSCSQLLD